MQTSGHILEYKNYICDLFKTITQKKQKNTLCNGNYKDYRAW